MLTEMGRRARAASRILALTSTESKNKTLLTLADLLETSRGEVLASNALDVSAATSNGLSEAMIDRLTLNEKRLDDLSSDLRHLAQLPDPVGEHFDETVLPNGLRLRKQRVPIGVMGVIYESRPNVTMDVTGLAIKTGNASILRGGSETINSNRALINIIQQALAANNLPADVIQFIDSAERSMVLELLKLHEYVDIIIPRGGGKLHQLCRENSQIPVITGGMGICHLFVDETADLAASLPLIYNSKVQRPSACNSLDTVLVHRTVAEKILPQIVDQLAPAGVSFRAHESAIPYLLQQNTGAYLDPETQQVAFGADVGGHLPESVQPAEADDFDIEWLNLTLGLKVVDGVSEAIAHIAAHSTAHSDGILTEDSANAALFINEVDSAAVYVNASTRFTDGAQFGLGAEVAISTQRLHARGPMGLRELTTYKWIAKGDYHIRE